MLKILLSCFITLTSLHAGAAEPYRIGLSLGLTGQYAAIVLHQAQGIKLWAKNVNGRGGLLGRPVELVIYDDTSDPATAAKLYEQLIHKDRVDFLLGPYSTPITAAAAAVAAANGWPMLVTGGSADSLWEKGYKHIIGAYSPASQFQVGLFELMLEAKISRIAVIHADDGFSISMADSAKTLANRYNLTIVHLESFRKGTVDLNGPLARAKAAKAEALLVEGHFDESINARRALKTMKWTPRLFFASVGPAVDKFGDVLKGDAEDTFTSTMWESRLRYPSSQEFDKNYKRTWNMPPSYHAAMIYAGGQVLESAAKSAGSLERMQLAKTLQDMNSITIIGRYGVDATGKQLRQQSFIAQWRNGRREIVYPKTLATTAPVIHP
ncbi:MAG: amino acid ABC transporter substrate-binding protein [Rhodocyclaceae bacterium]|nr:amino acid ABC transporter substrate-binding protein [Rhodocyclaceae bacterium]